MITGPWMRELYAFENQRSHQCSILIWLTELSSLCIATCTDFNVDSVLQFAPTKLWGSSTHRLQAKTVKSSICPNESPNKLRLVKLLTTAHEGYRGSQEDCNINVLHLYTLEAASMTLRGASPMKWPIVYQENTISISLTAIVVCWKSRTNP